MLLSCCSQGGAQPGTLNLLDSAGSPEGNGDERVRPVVQRMVLLSTDAPHPQDSVRDLQGGGRGNRVGSPLAQEELVLPSSLDGHGATGDVSHTDGPAHAGTVRTRPPVSPRLAGSRGLSTRRVYMRLELSVT